MKQIIHKLILLVRRSYWFVFRPNTSGVKVVVEHNGEVLMIRNTYGESAWTFPGGAINRQESPGNAARREVMEEAGIEIFKLNKIIELLNTREYKKDRVHVYTASTNNPKVIINSSEIKEFRWFNKSQFPSELSAIAEEIIYSLR